MHFGRTLIRTVVLKREYEIIWIKITNRNKNQLSRSVEVRLVSRLQVGCPLGFSSSVTLLVNGSLILVWQKLVLGNGLAGLK